MILIAGITGRIGQATARELLKAGHEVRGISRDPDSADALRSLGAEIVQADLAEKTTLSSPLRGIDRALLITANSEQQLDLERNFTESATAAGVNHIVKISSMEASPDARAPIPKLHYASEEIIKSSGIKWTMLQPNFFMQNLLMNAATIAAKGEFYLPFGDAQVAPLNTSDVASAAATVLTNEGHASRTYQLTNDKLMTFTDIADVMTEVLNRPVRYVDQEPEAYRAMLAQFIKSEWHVNAVAALFAEIKAGALAVTTSDLRTLIGRPPSTLAKFVVDHRRAFAPNG